MWGKRGYNIMQAEKNKQPQSRGKNRVLDAQQKNASFELHCREYRGASRHYSLTKTRTQHHIFGALNSDSDAKEICLGVGQQDSTQGNLKSTLWVTQRYRI